MNVRMQVTPGEPRFVTLGGYQKKCFILVRVDEFWPVIKSFDPVRTSVAASLT